MALLEVDGLTVAYRGIRAVRSFTFEVAEGEIVTILGSNGAGKTSTLNALMGLAPREEGVIRFDGTRIDRMPTEKIAKLGMTLTPEGRRVFPALTVGENLTLGAIAGKGRSGVAEARERAFTRFPILAERRRQLAGTLSGGEQQQLAIARSLMSAPRLLLLDEPSLGLAPVIVDFIFELLVGLRDDGVTILLGRVSHRFGEVRGRLVG
ncbi:MAG: ABC transporter ATP-binding protein [Actinobacteria bacterium]|nr:ABC transporter ATP-binding protein [Actinomycetota bacterium]